MKQLNFLLWCAAIADITCLIMLLWCEPQLTCDWTTTKVLETMFLVCGAWLIHEASRDRGFK